MVLQVLKISIYPVRPLRRDARTKNHVQYLYLIFCNFPKIMLTTCCLLSYKTTHFVIVLNIVFLNQHYTVRFCIGTHYWYFVQEFDILILCWDFTLSFYTSTLMFWLLMLDISIIHNYESLSACSRQSAISVLFFASWLPTATYKISRQSEPLVDYFTYYINKNFSIILSQSK
jgi:hypothetical protein